MEKLIRSYLKKYKTDVQAGALILASFILLSRIIVPQFDEVGKMQSDIEDQRETNLGLEESNTTLSSINDTDLDVYYDLVMGTLPSGKSVASIFEAINNAALRSGVSLSNLNLEIGSVYNSEPQKEAVGTAGVPFVNLTIRVTGNSTRDLTEFANELYETAPISEVNTISVSDSDGSYDLNFYFKPVNEKTYEAQTQVVKFNQPQLELLSTLEEWNQ